ncbi:glycosyltransferase [Nesterenkonia sp. Act20]|uniref:glycosyltransferase n=1 Tax=Nesterenkonia sp. Act20 TaxID=1483432 RepID=UPI001C4972AA|nr:glycosyltransferase [Nesterenkonia sp. Act20]
MSADSTDRAAGPADPVSPATHTIGYVLKMYPRFSETFIVSEILAREAAGEKIVIFSLRPSTDARFHPELARVRAPVVHVPRSSVASRFWAQFAEAAASPALAEGLQRALPELLEAGHDDAQQAVALAQSAEQAGVTHFHAHFASMATSVARLAGMISGLPYSFTAHAKDIFHEDVDPAELQTKLADAHHAITISGFNLEDLQRRFPAETSRLHLVRNGLELSRFPFTPGRNVRPADGDPPRLLGIGRLVEKKGFHLLIEAVSRLHSLGVPAQVSIAGDGPLRSELQERIDGAGLTSWVRLLGPCTQEEIGELLGTHDVFVAPFVVGADGNADGLPTVLLEAMARGIRCVAAQVTGVGELVRSAETGWLVPSGDVTALTKALLEALTLDAGHLALLTAARSCIEDHFDSTSQAATLRALVHDPQSVSCRESLVGSDTATTTVPLPMMRVEEPV